MSRRDRAKRKALTAARTKPHVTFYHDVKGRVVRCGRNYHRELFSAHRHRGLLWQEGLKTQLRLNVPFPDMETAITYVGTRRLGYEVTPPSFGHWIDPNYWTPLCIIPPLEAKDGQAG